MQDFNRRHIMQLAAAAGLAPALPALPARATVAAPAAASHAQMLWASLYARTGSTSGLAQVAQSMGMSAQTAAGMSAKVASARVLASHGSAKLAVGRRHIPTKSTQRQMTRRIDLKKWLTDDPVEDETPPQEPDVLETPDDT